MVTINQPEFHALSNLFPLMQGAKFDALVQDIRIHGVREPVVTLDGQILDGRNRYHASLVAGVDCQIREYDGDDPVAFVISQNLKRRHLSPSQRAMVAAKIANLTHGQKKADVEISTSQTDAAALLNISRESVIKAKAVCDHGAPELQYAVEHGYLAVSAAADLATVPVERQRDIIADLPHDADGKLMPGAKKTLAPIAKEIRAKKARRSKGECQLERFESAISYINNVCETAAKIDVPGISAKQAGDAIKKLAGAKTGISKLQRRIEREAIREANRAANKAAKSKPRSPSSRINSSATG